MSEKFNKKELELTGFQESRPYDPSIDLRTDFVMAYGIGKTMPERVAKWKEKGYVVHLMTGISWGQYQDYLEGEYDGVNHWDEAQVNMKGERIIHGTSQDIPYMVPSISFSNYLIEGLKVAVDSGVEAIHLEEPEFWVRGGYSDAFKREWRIFYKEKWAPPHESPENFYRASKLKAYLFTRCMDRLCSALKEYAISKYDRLLRFYVPTHSLINYTQWSIISPESKLMDLPAIDGYIAQIWTGTSRTKNYYKGVLKERTFETAFLEYGIMQELVRGTDRKMWFLTDPIEDNPRYTWSDYKKNYLKTVVASLLHPDIHTYEICPWPNRVFNGTYPAEDGNGKDSIPKDYATLLLTLMNTFRDMDQQDVSVKGISFNAGVLLADSSLYQKGDASWFDGNIENIDFTEESAWSPFYGLALPMLKQGIPVRPVQLDNVKRFPAYLDDIKLLVLSYEFMKCESPDINTTLANWVKQGGILVYVGDGSDVYHTIREWWNTGKKVYDNPAQHLFESLQLPRNPDGSYNVEQGKIIVVNVHPSIMAKTEEGCKLMQDTIKSTGIEYTPSNHLVMRRGPYIISAVLDECDSDAGLEITGNLIDIFGKNLPYIRKVVLNSGENGLYYDLDKVDSSNKTTLIASSSRVENLSEVDNGFEFIAEGPDKVPGIALFKSYKKPTKIICDNYVKLEWNSDSSTIRLKYDNVPDGLSIKIEY